MSAPQAWRAQNLVTEMAKNIYKIYNNVAFTVSWKLCVCVNKYILKLFFAWKRLVKILHSTLIETLSTATHLYKNKVLYVWESFWCCNHCFWKILCLVLKIHFWNIFLWNHLFNIPKSTMIEIFSLQRTFINIKL